ncbi:MAG: hypothetical protein R3F14_02070 [Polyangiaceae bacterium]
MSEEAGSIAYASTSGASVNKHLWKRTMQRKSDACASCAYDAVCGGVYAPYAELHGLGELSPLAARKPPPAPVGHGAPDTRLTRALRAVLVRPGNAGRALSMRVVRVRRLASGEHAIDCAGPRGDMLVEIRPREGAPPAPPPFATTARFAVHYRNPVPPADAGGPAPRVDLSLVEALVRALRRIEPHLPDDA